MHDYDFYGDKFKWFVATVREISPDRTKVRLRVFGVHRMDDVTDVSDGDLPYAVVLMPTTAGEGSNSNMTHGLQEGDMVVGFYADGDDCMQPIVVGVVPGGINSERNAASSSSGEGGGGGEGGGSGGGGGGGGGGSGIDESSDLPGEDINSLGAATGDCKAERQMSAAEKKHIDKAYNYLRNALETQMSDNEGEPHFQAVAIMGHISAESSWVLSVQNWNGEQAIGLCQWTPVGGRRQRVTSKPNWNTSLTVQLDHIFEEFRTTETIAWNRFRKAKTLWDAVVAFSSFERHAGVSLKTGRVNFDVAKARGRWNHRWCKANIYNEVFADRYTRPEFNQNSTFGGAI